MIMMYNDFILQVIKKKNLFSLVDAQVVQYSGRIEFPVSFKMRLVT